MSSPTSHPNHTWESCLRPLGQKTWDVNDTLDPDYQWQVTDPKSAPNAGFDPAEDRDVGGFFARLPRETYWPTWYFRRVDAAEALTYWPNQDADAKPLCQNAAIRRHEQEAARKSEAHANTPTVADFDSLGRPFLTVTHNRVQCQDHPGNNSDETYETRVELDIEGNQREVLDAKGRVVMRYKYDLLANRIHQASMEAGQRWMLNDVAGKPIRAWNSRRGPVSPPSTTPCVPMYSRSFVSGGMRVPGQPDVEIFADPVLSSASSMANSTPMPKRSTCAASPTCILTARGWSSAWGKPQHRGTRSLRLQGQPAA